MRIVVVLVCSVAFLTSLAPAADPKPPAKRWTQLAKASRPTTITRSIPAGGPIQPLSELSLTGPNPAHPFVLGNFAVDGQFGFVHGGIELVSGRNAALRLASQADQFELEGRIAMKDFGGWFLLVGWNEETGNGYAIHNCMMKTSGSPWFITEMRGNKAVEGTTQELRHFEWKHLQDVKVTVQESKLTFQLGSTKVLDTEELTNYQPGSVIFGVYDTRYGPRPVHINSLRIRALEE